MRVEIAHAMYSIRANATEFATRELTAPIMSMPKVTLLLLLAIASSTATAELRCSKDSFGTTRCSDGRTFREDSFGTRATLGVRTPLERQEITKAQPIAPTNLEPHGTTTGTRGAKILLAPFAGATALRVARTPSERHVAINHR